MKKLRFFFIGIVLIMMGFQSLIAQDLGRIEGTVYVTDGTTVVTDATVTLVGLNYSQRVDESGQFAFEEVPAGSVLLRVESPIWGRNSKTVTVVAGETSEADIEVLLHVRLEEIVVSAGPIALPRSQLVNPVNVLTRADLLEASGISLGESLKNQAGMASTYFGPGSSRPIIGGVGASRVKILRHGLDVGDVSDQSEDHAVSVDAFDAERIEIIRGPAALLYGSNITGGVVNVLDGHIPNEKPANRIEGMVMGRGGLGASERGGGGSLTGALGNFVWRARGLLRETGDVSTPLFNPESTHEGHEEHDEHGEHEEHDEHDEHEEHDEHDEHDEHEEGESQLVDHIENSGTSLSRGSLGVSWLGNRGYIGAAVSFHNTDYGVPGGHMHGHGEHGHDDHGDHEDHDDHEDHEDHDDHEEDEHGHGGEEEVSIALDLNSVTYDIEGAYFFEDAAIKEIRFRFGVTDYTHSELEQAESGPDMVGIVYENNQWEGRLEVDHSLHRKTQGVAGIQVKRRDLALNAVGDHSILPTTLTTDVGIFAMERIDLGALRLEMSGRMQWLSHDAVDRTDRSFSSLSLGAGLNYEASEQLTFSLSLARAAKNPSTAELYFNGVHAAIRSVERGNENLEVEVTNNATVSSYVRADQFSLTLTGYINQSDNFIYFAPTGLIEEDLPVLQTSQSEARITGMEIAADVDLFRREDSNLTLGLTGDYVNGRLTLEGGNLPRIPPLRLGASLQYSLNNFSTGLSVERIGKQDQVFTIAEDETDGYTMVDAKVGYRLVVGSTVQSISLQGLNLTNKLARAHTSLLKGIVPLPGRDIRLTYTFHF